MKDVMKNTCIECGEGKPFSKEWLANPANGPSVWVCPTCGNHSPLEDPLAIVRVVSRCQLIDLGEDNK